MKYTFLLTLILASTLCCNSQSVSFDGFKSNKEIPQDIRDRIAIQNDKFFYCVENTNPELFYDEVVSDTLKYFSGNNLKSIINQLNIFYDSKGYKIKDEFYIPMVKEDQFIHIISDLETDYEYKIELGIGDINTFVSLITFNDEAIMLGLIYREYEDDWKISFFGMGQYSIKGKLPVDFYKSAMSKYKKGYTVDATLDAALAMSGLTPNEFYRYTNHQIISDFALSLDSTVKADYIFPLTLNNIETKPKIIQIKPQVIDEGIYPSINYLTSVDLSDTISLKQENDLIQEEVGKIFPGIDKNKKYIIYTAMDKIGHQGMVNNVYGFVQKIKTNR